jgi:hypothetical protein
MSDLQPTLNLEARERHLKVTMTVRNTSTAAQTLQFTDANLLQIIVTTPSGASLYDSRAGKMFATVMRDVPVAPAQSVSFSEEWDAPPSAGDVLCVHAILRSHPPIEADGRIELKRT